jgi:hypothetical protein
MNAPWRWLVPLGSLVFLLLVGCRSTTPDLKPAKQPEVFNPPSDRANLAGYPKKAFDNGDDLAKRGGLDPRGLTQSPGMGASPGMSPANFNGPGGSGLR